MPGMVDKKPIDSGKCIPTRWTITCARGWDSLIPSPGVIKAERIDSLLPAFQESSLHLR